MQNNRSKIRGLKNITHKYLLQILLLFKEERHICIFKKILFLCFPAVEKNSLYIKHPHWRLAHYRHLAHVSLYCILCTYNVCVQTSRSDRMITIHIPSLLSADTLLESSLTVFSVSSNLCFKTVGTYILPMRNLIDLYVYYLVMDVWKTTKVKRYIETIHNLTR